MKIDKPIISILLLVFSSVCLAQKPAKEVFEDRLYLFYKDAGILNKSKSEIERMKKSSRKKKYTKRYKTYIEAFRIPNVLVNDDFLVTRDNSYPAFPLMDFGSMIFDKKSLDGQRDRILNLEPTTLMIKKNQVYLIKPSEDNNYNLKVNLSSLMDKALKSEAGGEYEKIFKAEAHVALSKTIEEKKHLSVVYGNFHNDLSRVFEETIRANSLTNYADFSVLYDVWSLLVNEPQLQDKYIIKHFRGLLIDESKEDAMIIDNSVEAMTQLNVNIPFVKLNSKAESDWSKQSQVGSSYKVSEMFINGAVSFQEIPSPEDIQKTWSNMLLNRGRRVNYPEGKFLSLADFQSSKSTLKILFGPLSLDIARDLDVRLKNDTELIRDVTIHDSVNDWEKHSSGLYFIPIIFDVNEQFLENSSDSRFIFDNSIELYLKKIISIGNDNNPIVLKEEFPFRLIIDAGYNLKVESINHDTIGQRNNWKLSVRCADPSKDISLNSIDFGNPKLNSFGESQFISDLSFTRNPSNPSIWDVEFSAELFPERIASPNVAALLNLEVLTSTNQIVPRTLRVSRFNIESSARANEETSSVVISTDFEDLAKILPDSITFDSVKVNTMFSDSEVPFISKLKAKEKVLESGIIVENKNGFELIIF
ncbi:MAG: hypothetical protein ABJG41_17050 [Cyclobacteriaceae bacterium]